MPSQSAFANQGHIQRNRVELASLGFCLVGTPVTTIASMEIDISTARNLRLAINLAQIAVCSGLVRGATVYLPDRVLSFVSDP